MLKSHSDFAYLSASALRRLDFELMHGSVSSRDLRKRFGLSFSALHARAASLGVDLQSRVSRGLAFTPPEALDSGCYRYRRLTGHSQDFEKEVM